MNIFHNRNVLPRDRFHRNLLNLAYTRSVDRWYLHDKLMPKEPRSRQPLPGVQLPPLGKA